MATPTPANVLTAITLLAPLIEKIGQYIAGGPWDPALESLPDTLKSEIALERAKARRG